MNAYDAWQNGDISPEAALRAICSDLGEVQSQKAPLEAEEKRLRAQASEVVARLGDKAEVPGFGKLEITGPSTAVSYDRTRVDNLVADLVERGHFEIVQALQACKTESMRAGSLRITRERGAR